VQRTVRRSRQQLPIRAARGFSLLEVLVAFVVLALVATALFRLFSGALANGGAADEYSRAVLVAQSRLTQLAVETPLREDQQLGTSADGRYSWESRVERYVPVDTTPDLERMGEFLQTRLWHLVVTVSWPSDSGRTRSYTLATVRLGGKE
jgi:general secretion pathway protein I